MQSTKNGVLLRGVVQQRPPQQKKARRKRSSISLERILLLLLLALVMIVIRVNLILLAPAQSSSPIVNVDPVSDTNVFRYSRDKLPLLHLLQQANVTITPELVQRLPTWHRVVERLGGNDKTTKLEPKIVGLDTCASYRALVPLKKRRLAIAGYVVFLMMVGCV